MASDKLHTEAIVNQAILLIKMNTSYNKKQYKESFKLLSLGIHLDKTNKDGLYYLGYLYENGLGVPNSKTLAFRYYKKAYKQGHLKAQTKVAIVLCNGIDDIIEIDEDRGLELLKQAAENNEPEALNHLALMYEKGSNGLPKDYNKCVELLKKSQSKGYSNASINLALLSSRTAPQTLKEQNETLEYLSLSAKKGNTMAQSIMHSFKNKKFSSTINVSNLMLEKEILNFEN